MNNPVDVIIVEDNELLRDSLKEAINKSSSIKCKNTFSSGESALDFISSEDLVPEISFLILVFPE